eukprot:2918996-Rhodomonas_salina.2
MRGMCPVGTCSGCPKATPNKTTRHVVSQQPGHTDEGGKEGVEERGEVEGGGGEKRELTSSWTLSSWNLVNLDPRVCISSFEFVLYCWHCTPTPHTH